MRIGLYVERLTADVASIWYRAFYPAAALRRRGWRVEVFDAAPSSRRMQRFDALIIVKVLNARALGLAMEARRFGVPVFLDLCDDIFVPDYGEGQGREAAFFRACAQFASAIVTTGPVMAEVIRRELGGQVRIVIIEDPAETRSHNRMVAADLRRWAAAAIVHHGAAMAYPPLGLGALTSRNMKVLRRFMRSLRKGVQRACGLLLHKTKRGRNIIARAARRSHKAVIRALGLLLHKTKRARNVTGHLLSRLYKAPERAVGYVLAKTKRGRRDSMRGIRALVRRVFGAPDGGGA